ncbi:ribonuclease H-like domain-containing protein [Tanacetum coccineum]
MDIGATFHLNSNARNLSTIFNTRLFPFIHVGDDNSIPVTNTEHSIIPSIHRPLHLHNVLVTPNIIKNLISVCQFTRDNNCTIEFDAFDFSVKDFLTRHILLRCDRSGDLYLVTKPSTLPAAFVSTSSTTWHQRLGHPRDEVFHSLTSRHFISCNKEMSPHVCHACQLGKHVKLPFHRLNSLVKQCFDIIHSDLWTSLIHKFHADGTLSRYKARLVANGSSQQFGVDFDETFIPVVKPATIHTVLALLCLPPGFVDDRFPNHVFRLQRSLYRLKQAPRAWFQRFAALLQHLIDSLHREFDMTDLGALNYFLGISAVCHSTGLFLSQRKYALHLLERAHMVNCNPSQHIESESKRGPMGSGSDPTCTESCRDFHTPLHVQICLMQFSRFAFICTIRESHINCSQAYLAICSGFHLSTATLVYCDNVSAVYMSANPVQHQRTKHIKIDIHFVRDMVTAG